MRGASLAGVAVVLGAAVGFIAAAAPGHRTLTSVPASHLRYAPRAPSSAPKAAVGTVSGPVRIRPTNDEPDQLIVRTHTGQVLLHASVGAMAAPVNADGSWRAFEPPYYDRAEWITQTAVPASNMPRVAAIYGHSCQYHSCSFTPLALRPGPAGSRQPRAVSELTRATVELVSPLATRLTWHVVTVRRYCKQSGCDQHETPTANSISRDAPGELVLVACAYDDPSTSRYNVVVIAKRTVSG